MRQLRELEGICTGIVEKSGPCTAYHVRSELKISPSAHWQASAGSVYPLLARLEVQGLLTGIDDPQDGRGRRLLRATAKGRAALREWIKAGAQPKLITSITDPVRSRMFFLQALSAADQRAYLDRTIQQMQAHLSETQARRAGADIVKDRYDYYGALGAEKLTHTRLEWLKTVRAGLLEVAEN